VRVDINVISVMAAYMPP